VRIARPRGTGDAEGEARSGALWLRSNRVEGTEGWRLSRRASAAKAELMTRFAEAGRPYGLSVPRASNHWP